MTGAAISVTHRSGRNAEVCDPVTWPPSIAKGELLTGKVLISLIMIDVTVLLLLLLLLLIIIITIVTCRCCRDPHDPPRSSPRADASACGEERIVLSTQLYNLRCPVYEKKVYKLMYTYTLTYALYIYIY